MRSGHATGETGHRDLPELADAAVLNNRMPRLSARVGRLRSSELAAESTWGLALEIVSLLNSLVAFTLLGRTLGAAGYGGYASLYALVGPLVTLAASGVVLALLQHVVRDGEPIGETARSCLTLSLLLGLGLTVIGGGIAAAVVEGLTVIAITSILLTEFVTSPVIQVSASTLQAGTGFTPAAKLRIVQVSGRIVIVIALFVADSLTIATLGVTNLVFTGVIGAASLGPVGRRYGFRFLPGAVRLRHLKTNALYSTAISASALNTDGDKIVLAANKLVVDTGLYSAAYRIVSFGLVPIGSLTQVSHRYFLEHDENVKGQHLRLSWRFGKIAGAYGVLFGIGLFIGAPLLPYLLGDEFEGSVSMARWLAPTAAMRALGIFAINGLMGLGKTGFRTVLIVVNAALATVGYVILVPLYGWEGAAIGTLASEALAMISGWWALFHYQRKHDQAVDDRLAAEQDDDEETASVMAQGDADRTE